MYAKRPKCLEHYCLADYISELDVVYPKHDNNTDIVANVTNDVDCCDEEQVDLDQNKIIAVKNGIVIKKRRTPKAIRYVRFNMKTDEENYFRENLLLFHP